MRIFLTTMLALILTACGNVPITSIPKIRAIDMATTDLTQLSAVAKFPDAIKADDLRIEYYVSIENVDTGEKEELISKLEPQSGDQETQNLISKESEAGYQFLAYRIPRGDIEKINVLRETIANWRENGYEAKGRTGFRMDGACYQENASADKKWGNLWVRAEETDGYVHMLKRVDLSPEAFEKEAGQQANICE